MKPAIALNDKRKGLILGPCSAESEEQMDAIAQAILHFKPDFVRAGLWKPRTRPGHFQGMGAAAIPWLVGIQKKYKLKICTEVATSQHVELALKAGFDALWIGARTTVNPFYVQDIADALKGVDIPVFVKNPINPDLFLWLGAIERMLQVGIQRVAAIHRGFSFYGNSVYRNVPRWQIPIELRRRMPDLQMLADISHISGRPDNLLEIAQIAYDLNYDGLMVEVHNQPEKALSDADQQVTADFLQTEILDKLILRSIASNDFAFNKQIEAIRTGIDAIDEEIVHLLAKRMLLAEQIGLEKKENSIAIFQPKRWDQIVVRLLEIGKKEGLSEEFIFSLIEAIHIESIQHQSQKMNKEIAVLEEDLSTRLNQK
ncbi:MAG: bifunctional 3-deoxy-7-phosphoheptulonate synthase/chorismate mutase type II [Saprospiraceae bacterium]|nr:bifunctional 3-deoxy-7-phosphoheptulonate synthase/chorismate mutase type II [Saprospiraceae bacterium]